MVRKYLHFIILFEDFLHQEAQAPLYKVGTNKDTKFRQQSIRKRIMAK